MAVAMKQYCVAFDVGKLKDPSAIQIWKNNLVYVPETNSTPARQLWKDDLVMQIRIMDKRHTYTAHLIADLLRRENLAANSVLVFDSTGVGEALKDILWDKEGIRNMIPIKYTAGGREKVVYRTEGEDQRFALSQGDKLQNQMKYLECINVPKNMMVEEAQRSMELGEIRIAPGIPYREEFRIQMQSFTGRMNKKGYTSFNNEADSIHDDWVNCFMMRSWYRSRFRKLITGESHEYQKSDEIADILGRRGGDRDLWL